MTEITLRLVVCCVLYIVCFLLYTNDALPSLQETVVSHVRNLDKENVKQPTSEAIIERPRLAVGTSRQAGILAALGTAVAPFLIGLISPLISQFASMVSSAVLGKLQAETVNNTTPPHYEAYMINMPDQPGPYLFLTTPTRDKNDQKNPATSPLSTFGQLPAVRKTPKISQHLGTVNIKTNLNDAVRLSREMRIPPTTTETAEN